ncbi:MAG: prolipoprotein diacylglyceryl transferase [Phycisphaeraceae bacterium]|nr:MAG: prolipoprotein diacylglyceryl transferase [Phycisphaeraceae bacterium]
MTDHAWFHSINPVILHLWGSFSVRWYGLSYLAGFVLGFLILRTLARRRLTPLPADRALDALMLLVFGVVLGGRLGYVLVYRRELLWSFDHHLPYWGALKIHEGGMASHGGMVGVVVAAYLISRGFRQPDGLRTGRAPFLHALDLTAFIAPPGLLLGRLANFINGELLGKIVAQPGQPAPWWSVRFPQELTSKHAPPLTDPQSDALADLIATHQRAGQPAAEALDAILARAARAARGDHAIIEQLRPLVSARHPSQLYQAFAEGVVLFAVLALLWLTPRRPGTLAAAFLITYGIGRILTEFWRLPDAHLAQQTIAGLSRGQWLSAAMILAGLALIPVIRRQNLPAMGGLLRPAPLPADPSR